MEQNKKFQENLETDSIADALLEELEAIGRQAIEENAQLDKIPYYQLQPRSNKRFSRFISSRMRRGKPYWRVTKRALAIAAILLSIVIATQAGAIRTVLGNIFMTRNQQSINLTDRTNAPLFYDIDPIPSYICEPPKGYQLVDYLKRGGLIELLYLNDDFEKIWVVVYQGGTSARIDGEKLDNYTLVPIGEQEGFLIEKQGNVILSWGQGTIIQIRGSRKEKQAILQMAQCIVESPGYPG